MADHNENLKDTLNEEIKHADQKPAEEHYSLNDDRRVKVLSPGMLVAKRFFRNRLAVTGMAILVFMFVFSFIGGVISPYKQDQFFYADKTIRREFAAVIKNTEFRYSSADDSVFGLPAQAQAMLAIQQQKDGFTYRDNRFTHELFGGVGAAQTAAALIQAAARQDLLRDLLRDGHHLAPQPLVRRQQGIAAVVAHQKFGVGHGATQTDEALEVFILRLAAGLQVVHGHLSNETGPLLQLVPPLGEVIVIAQGEKGHAQQQQRQHHHAGGQGELLPVEPAEPFLALCHHFTSNL